jgi:hypothetical protein
VPLCDIDPRIGNLADPGGDLINIRDLFSCGRVAGRGFRLVLHAKHGHEFERPGITILIDINAAYLGLRAGPVAWRYR